jgi:acyl carrier protein
VSHGASFGCAAVNLLQGETSASSMDTINRVKSILRSALSLGDRADRLTASSPLLGSIPEFDSMAVVTVVTMLEDELDITVTDDELSADVFATVGSLAEFVDQKMHS